MNRRGRDQRADDPVDKAPDQLPLVEPLLAEYEVDVREHGDAIAEQALAAKGDQRLGERGSGDSRKI
jgi:hypothetical protein